MKKKQLAKLQQQFQPSFHSTQSNVFRTMERKIKEKYGFKIEAFNQAEHPNELVIRRLDLDEDAKDKEIHVPLDENFIDVIKRIQKGEKGLKELFSDNLAQEVAGFWSSAKQPQTQSNSTVSEEDSKGNEAMSYSTFSEKVSEYTNFYVETTDSHYEVKEQTKAEPRLLATISKQTANEYTIETALKRKYKLKLSLVPIIEKFANTPLDRR